MMDFEAVQGFTIDGRNSDVRTDLAGCLSAPKREGGEWPSSVQGGVVKCGAMGCGCGVLHEMNPQAAFIDLCQSPTYELMYVLAESKM